MLWYSRPAAGVSAVDARAVPDVETIRYYSPKMKLALAPEGARASAVRRLTRINTTDNVPQPSGRLPDLASTCGLMEAFLLYLALTRRRPPHLAGAEAPSRWCRGQRQYSCGRSLARGPPRILKSVERGRTTTMCHSVGVDNGDEAAEDLRARSR